MKMVKSLLLGTAAGFVAVAGAQAADMPVKAKPVQYVKICTLYGDGYYYIPGSDTCIKLGGYVRGDYGWNVTGARTPQYSGTAGAQDRTVAQFSTRHRANLTIDTRTQTQYGTLRTLSSIHINNENQTESFNVSRAFIQWAGFTFGRAQSFSDTWQINDSWHLVQQQTGSDTGANGVNQIAYTFEFGNGFTVSLGADERRSKSLTNLSVGSSLKIAAEPTEYRGGEVWPDPHITFRVDQAWGYWSIVGMAHNNNVSYYTDSPTTGLAGYACPAPGGQGPANSPLTICGHPSDKVGWAVLSGGEVKLPMLGPADRAGYMAHYGVGASAFSGGSNLASPDLFGTGNQVAAGWITDGVYVNGSGIELTTTWSVGAGYEHSWTPTVKTSWAAAYARVSYDSTAQNYFAGAVCGVAGTGAAAQTGFQLTPGGNCNPNWSFAQGGMRTMWTPVPGFFLAVDSVYTQVWTAFSGSTATLQGVNTSATTGLQTAINPVSGARPNGVYSLNNQGIWSFVFRAQRNFNAGD